MARGYELPELVLELDRALGDLEASRIRGSSFAPAKLDGARSAARRALEQIVSNQSQLPPDSGEGEKLATLGNDISYVLNALELTVRAPGKAVRQLSDARVRLSQALTSI